MKIPAGTHPVCTDPTKGFYLKAQLTPSHLFSAQSVSACSLRTGICSAVFIYLYIQLHLHYSSIPHASGVLAVFPDIALKESRDLKPQWNLHTLNVPLFFLHSGNRGWPNRWGTEGDVRQVFAWGLNTTDALQTFYFDHRFEALVGCACSRRIEGENDSTKQWARIKRKRTAHSRVWKHRREVREDMVKEWKKWKGRDSGRDLSLGLLAILQNESWFEDVEMADTLCISTSADFHDGWTCHYLHDHVSFNFLSKKRCKQQKTLQLKAEAKSRPHLKMLYSS